MIGHKKMSDEMFSELIQSIKEAALIEKEKWNLRVSLLLML